MLIIKKSFIITILAIIQSIRNSTIKLSSIIKWGLDFRVGKYT